MILSGLLPKTLPNWMDHGYNPHYLPDATGTWTLRPEVPAGQYGKLFTSDFKAFTWVDLVFPMFLFSLGAAIPMAMRRRQRDGYAGVEMLSFIGARWLVLVLFAVAVNYLTSGRLTSSNPDTSRFLAIGSFLIACLFFVRWPDSVPPAVVWAIRMTALVLIIIRIAAFTIRNEETFTWGRADIIILVLAYTYAFGSLLWMLTSNLHGVRVMLALPLMLLAHQTQYSGEQLAKVHWVLGDVNTIVQSSVGWIHSVLNFGKWVPGLSMLAQDNAWIRDLFDLSRLWHFSWLKYLWVVIPGTIVGDWLDGWSQRRSIGEIEYFPSSKMPRASYVLVALLFVSVFVGLRHYGHPTFGWGGVFQTPTLAAVFGGVLLIALLAITWPQAYGHLWVTRKLLSWGALLTALGLVMACVPINGQFLERGISKGPPASLSYYILSVGLCMLLLVVLVPLFDVKRWRDPVSSVVAANGANAMLAYFLSHATASAVFKLSIFAAFGLPLGETVRSLDDLARKLMPGTAGQTGWAVLQTLAIALFVFLCTRLRIFWRA
jgi:predicted acyltransferase